MATTTTKLGLRKPDRTDLIYVPTDLDGVYDKIDAAVGDTICTTATRPAVPWSGQPIYETDTGAEAVWNGAAWKYPTDPIAVVTSGARPASPITGSNAYETDTGNEIVWDAFNWAHPSVPIVSAFAQILRPRTNQTVLLSTDQCYYFYTGSLWAPIKAKQTLSGLLRTTSATAFSAETVWATTAATVLPQNAMITVQVDVVYTGTVTADQFFFKLRQTNLAGAVLCTFVPPIIAGAGGGPYAFKFHYTFSTGGAATQTFAATAIRNAGTGNIQPLLQSKLTVFCEGPAANWSTI